VKRRTILAGAAISGAVLVVLVGYSVAGSAPPVGGLRTVRVGPFPYAMALDARTGHLLVVTEGQLKQDGSVSLLDAATGRLLRTVTVGAVPETVTVDGRHGRVYVVNAQDATVSVLDARSGHVVTTLGPFLGLSGKFSRVRMGVSSLAVDAPAGRAFISTLAHRGPGGSSLFIFDTARLSRLRVLSAGPTAYALAVDERTHHVFVLDLGTASSRGHIGGEITMVAGATGRVLRQVSLAGAPLAIVVDGWRGHAFVLVRTGTVNTLDVLTTRGARVVRTIPLGTVDGPLVLAERLGHLFVADGTRVLMLDARTGRVLRVTRVPHAVTALVVSERAGRVYLVHGQAASVSVLDARSGALTRTFGVVQDPTAITVDDRTQRVFVASNDVSAGVNSGEWDTNLLANVVTTLRNTLRGPRTGWTGSVTTFDLRSVR
jgi:DNA-binding beta-propeller fold protein YncE